MKHFFFTLAVTLTVTASASSYNFSEDLRKDDINQDELHLFIQSHFQEGQQEDYSAQQEFEEDHGHLVGQQEEDHLQDIETQLDVLNREIRKVEDAQRMSLGDYLPTTENFRQWEVPRKIENYTYEVLRGTATGMLALARTCARQAGGSCRIARNLGVWRANNSERCKKGRNKYSCHLVGQAIDVSFSNNCNINRIMNCSRKNTGWAKLYGSGKRGGWVHIGGGSCSEARRLPMPNGCR